MTDVGRRSALALGSICLSGLLLPDIASAETYSPTAGKEVAPGIKQVDLGKADSHLSGYKTVSMRDIVFQPKVKFDVRSMPNDMVCFMTDGELRIKQNDKSFTVKKGEMYTCMKGMTEEDTNGSTVAVMRVIDLLPA